jgi:hypothetical protein
VPVVAVVPVAPVVVVEAPPVDDGAVVVVVVGGGVPAAGWDAGDAVDGWVAVVGVTGAVSTGLAYR